jgi:hypothetical protein
MRKQKQWQRHGHKVQARAGTKHRSFLYAVAMVSNATCPHARHGRLPPASDFKSNKVACLNHDQWKCSRMKALSPAMGSLVWHTSHPHACMPPCHASVEETFTGHAVDENKTLQLATPASPETTRSPAPLLVARRAHASTNPSAMRG